MDLILEVADDLVLDNMWAKLVPIPDVTSTVNAYTTENMTQAFPNSWLSAVATNLPSVLLPPPPSSILVESISLSGQSAWPRDYVLRQLLSVTVITLIGIHLLYFVFAAASYFFVFDHRMMKHPRFLKNQVKLEIHTSLKSFPGMLLLTLPWFQGEVMGYSRLYNDPKEYGIAYLFFSIFLFLIVTDYCIYWIHRWLHLPFLYKHIHKPHHKWLVPTPFASHAFHPVDGFSQSLPYHLFVYIFPMQRHLYLILFNLVNIWSVFIHDSDMFVSPGGRVEKYINTPAHHTLHHLYFTCNYGQYFTWADRLGGSYRPPQPDLDPLKEALAACKSE
ncbi:C5-sterol desaturase [Cantharellus anzutake]|uniref:C5-sterol desaturase n=1 Tax=Cantharellus anzutake TaxID=1750568 RepID=UPI001905B9F7|nr:C5-sterol desaturase [Cantharellus anzutake]KAF8340484.1 C5-sterol desaturase [Cantharellus anzutake]